MHTFETTKSTILDINQKLVSLFRQAQAIPGIAHNPFMEWGKITESIKRQIHEDTIRVAVVGSIKSGKSTFVNAFLGGDYLKRGAGVITSIVTRVRKGSDLKATLTFKTWEEINTEIRQAMVLFPSSALLSREKDFDIRNDADREGLRQALQSLKVEQFISQESFDANVTLLTSYLKGYRKARDIVSQERNTAEFEPADFARHKEFVGNDYLAIYLKDLELHIPGNRLLNDNIEIADCQGSDSLNPLHLSMILDYLIKAHMIIYIVSSRTGIRQADMKFLSMIKRMGLGANIFFLINCDFSEHENIDDLERIITKVREDITLLIPSPKVFSFSTLYFLFTQIDQNLSPKDKARHTHWQEDPQLVSFAEQEKEDFLGTLHEKLERDRLNLLLKNHIERLTVMIRGLSDWIRLNREVLGQDSESARKVYIRLQQEQKQIHHLQKLIKNTLDGASDKVKHDIRQDTDQFFDIRHGDLIRHIQDFVRNYADNPAKTREDLEKMGFAASLYMLFQDFKRTLDLFMADTINPRLVAFVREEETKIRTFLTNVSGSYSSLINTTFVRYLETLDTFGIASVQPPPETEESFEETLLTQTGNLAALPPLTFTLQYTSQIRTEAFVRRSFSAFSKFFKRFRKPGTETDQAEDTHALQAMLKKIKQNTERALIFHFNNYRENLKFQYLFKFTEIQTHAIHTRLLERFHAFTSGFSEMARLMGNDQTSKEEALAILTAMEQSSKTLLQQIETIKADKAL